MTESEDIVEQLRMLVFFDPENTVAADDVCERAADELERLRAIVAKFTTTTADGAVVYDGMEVWYAPSRQHPARKHQACMAVYDGDFYEPHVPDWETYYSTEQLAKEAAEAAKEKK